MRFQEGSDRYGFRDESTAAEFGVTSETQYGPSVLCWRFDSGNSEVTFYRNGVQKGAAVSYTPFDFDVDSLEITLGTSATDSFSIVDMAEVYVTGSVLTDAELEQFWNYFGARYNLPMGSQASVPLSSANVPTAVSVVTALGDFACIDEVTDTTDEWVFSLEDDGAYIRAEITGEGELQANGDFHITSIDSRTHAGGPVPFILVGSGIESNGLTCYSEDEAAKSGVLYPDGHTLVPSMITEETIAFSSIA